jgi:hypothetical protein
VSLLACERAVERLGDVCAAEGKFWSNFVTKTKGMSPDERAKALEADEEVREAGDVAPRGLC